MDIRSKIQQSLFSTKELKLLMADLKRVYAAAAEEIALSEPDSFDEKWSRK